MLEQWRASGTLLHIYLACRGKVVHGRVVAWDDFTLLVATADGRFESLHKRGVALMLPPGAPRVHTMGTLPRPPQGRRKIAGGVVRAPHVPGEPEGPDRA